MTAPAEVPGPFTWTLRDTNRAFALVLALDVAGQFAHAAQLRVAMIDLQYMTRAPRLADAWLFFHAARLIERGDGFATSDGTLLIVFAQQLGARCWFAVRSHEVPRDVHRVDAGGSTEYVAELIDGRDAPYDFAPGNAQRLRRRYVELRGIRESDATGEK